MSSSSFSRLGQLRSDGTSQAIRCLPVGLGEQAPGVLLAPSPTLPFSRMTPHLILAPVNVERASQEVGDAQWGIDIVLGTEKIPVRCELAAKRGHGCWLPQANRTALHSAAFSRPDACATLGVKA